MEPKYSNHLRIVTAQREDGRTEVVAFSMIEDTFDVQWSTPGVVRFPMRPRGISYPPPFPPPRPMDLRNVDWSYKVRY